MEQLSFANPHLFTEGMWPGLTFAITLTLALALGLYLTPIVRHGALRFGVLDKPDGVLKTQQQAVPYLGGIAVYLAFLVTLSIVFDFSHQLLGLLLGGTMVTMLGLFDDLKVLPPGLKVVGQLLAAWVMVKSGILIELVFIPEFLALPFTFLWLLGVTNAINIFDVSDGLTTSTSAISAGALFLVALINGDILIATTALALAGSLTGFYFYNRAPASIYLGDAGSLFIGFMLAALAMIGSYTERNVLGALAPVFFLMAPLLETCLVTVARLAKGRSPFLGSRDHMALRLKGRGWSAPQVARTAMLLNLFGCGIGFVLIYAPPSWSIAVLLTALVILGVLFSWLWFSCPCPSDPSEERQAQEAILGS